MALMLVGSGLLRTWCQQKSGPTLYSMHENRSINRSLSLSLSLSVISPNLIVPSGQGTLNNAGRRLVGQHLMSKIGSTADSGLTVVREADGRSQPKSLMGISAGPSNGI